MEYYKIELSRIDVEQLISIKEAAVKNIEQEILILTEKINSDNESITKLKKSLYSTLEQEKITVPDHHKTTADKTPMDTLRQKIMYVFNITQSELSTNEMHTELLKHFSIESEKSKLLLQNISKELGRHANDGKYYYKNGKDANGKVRYGRLKS